MAGAIGGLKILKYVIWQLLLRKFVIGIGNTGFPIIAAWTSNYFLILKYKGETSSTPRRLAGYIGVLKIIKYVVSWKGEGTATWDGN